MARETRPIGACRYSNRSVLGSRELTKLLSHRGFFDYRTAEKTAGRQDHTTWPSALGSLVWRPQHVHRIPPSTLLTMRSAPLIERGMRGEKHEFPKNGSTIFSRRGLETPDRP